MRKYGFAESDICFDKSGFLPLEIDPKEYWARLHPDYFPVNVNKASKYQLLRVPGLGEVTVGRILEHRKIVSINSIRDIGKPTRLLEKANEYLRF